MYCIKIPKKKHTFHRHGAQYKDSNEIYMRTNKRMQSKSWCVVVDQMVRRRCAFKLSSYQFVFVFFFYFFRYLFSIQWSASFLPIFLINLNLICDLIKRIAPFPIYSNQMRSVQLWCFKWCRQAQSFLRHLEFNSIRIGFEPKRIREWVTSIFALVLA